jgi:hypothetical protein
MPFIHGSRLRRYGGKINQVDRVIKLLKTKASTRALAVLIDPFRDFTADGVDEEFASFCLVQFKRRELGGAQRAVDVIAFYRAQEFARWWPINIAEITFNGRSARRLGFCRGGSRPLQGTLARIRVHRRKLRCQLSTDGWIRLPNGFIGSRTH